MQKVLLVILVLLLAEIVTAQDPGIPDTVNFGECQSYIVAEGDSFNGKVRVPLRIFNDENLASIQEICLRWTGPLVSDTYLFYGERADSIEFSGFSFFDFNFEHFINTWAFFRDGGAPSDIGIFLYMFFSAFDTGMFQIDTTHAAIPECPLWFVSLQLDAWRPLFEAKEFQLVRSDTIPGDLNGSSRTDLVDIIILVNFTFKSIYPGFLKPAADVNSDCKIDLADIIYLVNYIYKSGQKPKPGCAF